MRCVGLTGGIGSGKSTVAKMLTVAGAALIDADAISRASTAAGGAAMPQIEKRFGAKLMSADGSLNRMAMRELILREPQAKQDLEALIHPIVAAEVGEQRAAHRAAGNALCVFDIPLLAEGAARWRPQLDSIWVVDCSEQTQIERVMVRSQWPREQVLAVIAAQANREERRAVADAVIVNENLSFVQLQAQIDVLMQEFLMKLKRTML